MRITPIFLALLIAGCSSTPSDERYELADDVAPTSSPTLDHIEDAQPRYEPFSLAGNKDYTLRGKDYKIVRGDQPFIEEGYASWYGQKFHGHKTSNGEIYDMYSMTAAHKTLPLPSYVKVTNTKNGKTAIVRVNDRGPFHDGRIIDLSMAAAARLDVIKNGTAPVRIELIRIAKPANPDEWQSANPNFYFVQLAAVTDAEKAEAMAAQLKQEFASPIDTQKSDAGEVYRLRLGPFIDRDEAVSLRDKAKSSHYPQAFIITSKRELEPKS
ncbi:rare lipoprotein A [Photobacterium aquae]|uniref:Endolytic peptidoglycan transglycosylase RlpA n=1 Tax=Photobacterium aquae TaxID=1195763 RepID=A0A0J1H423_9GAMM|nr:septal ring lytic transglycosylase RlpA family protein [Photobacterium aquae]KLV06459.1 rare lipoprotein A [Photobacterium aquae]